MSYTVTIEENLGYIRHEDFFRTAYRVVVNETVEESSDIIEVHGYAPTFDRTIAEGWAQELRDFYGTEGSEVDHYEVVQIGLQLFFHIVLQDGRSYSPHFLAIGADGSTSQNRRFFQQAVLERHGFIKAPENEITSWNAKTDSFEAICGVYYRKEDV